MDRTELCAPLILTGELPVTARHASAVARLPDRPRDPFDRLLVAQSLVEPMLLLTHDRMLAKYGSSVVVAK